MYIDPGSGSMLVQVVLATALGSVIALRRKLAAIMAKLLMHLRPK